MSKLQSIRKFFGKSAKKQTNPFLFLRAREFRKKFNKKKLENKRRKFRLMVRKFL